MKVKFQGKEVSLSGVVKRVGDLAPEVKLVDKDLSEVTISKVPGKLQILNVVPSLDTPVCAIQNRRFNKEASSLSNAIVYVISMDLPFAQGRFCSVEGIDNIHVLSDFNHRDFGNKYGLRIAEGPLSGLLTRAVIILDSEGKIAYQEICEEITKEPDYESAIHFVQKH